MAVLPLQGIAAPPQEWSRVVLSLLWGILPRFGSSFKSHQDQLPHVWAARTHHSQHHVGLVFVIG
eukprot:1868045-Amphidinium_carterae.1